MSTQQMLHALILKYLEEKGYKDTLKLMNEYLSGNDVEMFDVDGFDSLQNIINGYYDRMSNDMNPYLKNESKTVFNELDYDVEMKTYNDLNRLYSESKLNNQTNGIIIHNLSMDYNRVVLFEKYGIFSDPIKIELTPTNDKQSATIIFKTINDAIKTMKHFSKLESTKIEYIPISRTDIPRDSNALIIYHNKIHKNIPKFKTFISKFISCSFKLMEITKKFIIIKFENNQICSQFYSKLFMETFKKSKLYMEFFKLNIKSNSILISNVHDVVTESKLQNICSKFGSISSIIKLDNSSSSNNFNKFKVTFTTNNAALTAQQKLSNIEINWLRLNVSFTDE